MAIFTSKSSKTFFDSAIHDAIPEDALEITREQHAELFAGKSAGKVICWGADGMPYLAYPPKPTKAELEEQARVWRDGQLLVTDPLVARHRDEQEADGETTLTSEQYSQLQQYRKWLREWPQVESFPSDGQRPVAPSWLAELVE
ncbi:phage tail assembly chaperone [Pseudomonas sp. LAM2023]|uniref:phage tail assembly chaperone n=1 Tax=Pseudomonas sp. LAM2023 TaxID=2800477 RepID=UPI00190D8D98|nr:phage tail assembly chaperone [Pseudomonas sp. LAM2023]